MFIIRIIKIEKTYVIGNEIQINPLEMMNYTKSPDRIEDIKNSVYVIVIK